MSHQPEHDQIEPAPQTPANPSRRKLAVGLGAGVAMTLSGRSALAVECFKPSAWASASHLSHRGTVSTCTGRTRAQWAGISPGNLPGGNPRFRNVFPNGNGINFLFGDRFDDVLDRPDNGNTGSRPNPIAAEFVAAYLNVVSGRIPSTVMSTGALISMWNEWRNNGAVSGGYITVRNNVQLDTNEIVAYLQSLNRT